MRNVGPVLLAVVLPFAASDVRGDEAEASSSKLDRSYENDVGPLLTRYCTNCHGPEKQEGRLRIDTLDPDLARGDDGETWHDVLDRLNLDEMPPRDAPQPTARERRRITEWLTGAMREAEATKRFATGRVVTRRLTRYEYRNTMRDLLGVDLDYAADLPPDPASPDGFLNNGGTLEMSPLQIEACLAAARRGLKWAIVEGDRPEVHELRVETTDRGRLPQRGDDPPRPEFLASIERFPREGEFEIRLTVGAVGPEGAGHPRVRVTMGFVPGIVHVPRKVVGEADVTASADAPQTLVFRGRMEDFPQPGDRSFGNTDFDGMIVLVDFLDADGNELRYPDRQYAVPPAKAKKKPKGSEAETPVPPAEKPVDSNRLDVVVRSFEYEAPLLTNWPPESHRRILEAGEADTDTADERARVVTILRRFVSRAFRRPATATDVDRFTRLFDLVRANSPSFEEALRETLAAVLVSPRFLYVVETRTGTTAGERVDEFELASRLSYFLWSSMPDDRLFELARTGELDEPATLAAEVERMLADPRSNEFTTRFADQWFDLAALDRVAVNPEFHPGFDEGLKEHMRNESRAFLAELLRSDESCLAMLDSDWTMLNRPLAGHYGIAGPRGSAFKRVSLPPGSRRGGLLGQGAFLLGGSNGETPHPIKRAVWILDRLLDSPPAPPPPDVPELDADSPDLAGLTLKRQLELHRAKKSCANCHRGIDPWGIALEHFDAVGTWREHEATRRPAKKSKRPANSAPNAIDATTALPDGTSIDGASELRSYLIERRREQFSRAVVKRLATYALGRSLDVGDRPTVRSLTKSFTESDHRLHALIVALVQSDTFLSK